MASLSSNWIKHADVDGDGEEELVVVISNACMVFKVKTDDEYELFWYKRFYASWSYVSLKVCDINSDGRAELLFGRTKRINNASDDYTEIYTFDPLSDVQKLTEIPKGLEFVTGFPNPANTTISMEFSLNEHANVSTYLLAENGKIIETRQLGRLSTGTFLNTITTRHLKSGVYFYQIITEQNSVSTKFLVIH